MNIKLILLSFLSLVVFLSFSSCQKPNPILFEPMVVNIEKIIHWEASSDEGHIQHPSFIQGDIAFFDEYVDNPTKDKPEFTGQYLRKRLIAKSLPYGKVIWTSPESFNQVVIPYDPISNNLFFAVAFAENQILLPTIKNELVSLSLPNFSEQWSILSKKPIQDLLGCNQTQVFYTNSENELIAVNLKTAKVDWQLQMNQSITQFQLMDQERIALITKDKHELWLVNTQTGTTEWIYKSQDTILHRSIAVKDSKMIFLSEKKIDEAEFTIIQVYDFQTKKMLWAKEIKGFHRSMYLDEKISICGDSLFLPFLVDGKPVQLRLEDGKDITSGKLINHVLSSEKERDGYDYCEVRGDYLFLMNTKKGGIYCYDKNQDFMWHLPCHQIVYGPVIIRDQFLFVSDRSKLKKQRNLSQYFLVELDTGNIIWKEEREPVSPENELFFFDSPHWNDIMFPDRKQAWDLSPILEEWKRLGGRLQ